MSEWRRDTGDRTVPMEDIVPAPDIETKVFVKQGGRVDAWSEWNRPLGEVMDELEKRLMETGTAPSSFEVVEVEVRKRRVLRRTVEILGEDK